MSESGSVNSEIAELRGELARQNELIAELQLSRTQKAVRLMRVQKRLIAATLFCFVGIPLLHAAVPHTFTAGTAAVASEVNANLTYLDEISVPVGGIIGWHKSFANVPALPASGKWVECNGQVLVDALSPLNGQTVPNLNGESSGVNSPGQTAKVAMFLRGGVTSGTGQQDAFQGHHHQLYLNQSSPSVGGAGPHTTGGGPETLATPSGNGASPGDSIRMATTNGTNGTPRTANETRPVNMTVVWIMRVK